MWNLSFCVWLISFDMMSSTFSQMIGFPSCLRLNSILLYMCTVFSWSIHPLGDPFLAIVSNAAVQTPLQHTNLNSIGYVSRSWITRSYGNCIFSVLGKLHTVFHNGYNWFSFLRRVGKDFLFSTSSPTLIISHRFVWLLFIFCYWLFVCLFAVLEVEPIASCILGKHSNPEPHPAVFHVFDSQPHRWEVISQCHSNPVPPWWLVMFSIS
jgi:hypothetical protein